MKITNYEFKARAHNLEQLEEKLLALNAVFEGEDHQIDTYFNVEKGRLKLREGNIENALIFYERENAADAKKSNVQLYQHAPSSSLKGLLTKVHGVKVVVDKRRRIYFIDNVKFHFDRLETLGTFVEVEAIDRTGMVKIDVLKAQCARYFNFFGLQQSNLVAQSYSDLLLEQQQLG